mgnify:CR=1 FL=1
MKNAIKILFFLITSYNLQAQQDALYSQYMFNQLVINPAYAGSRESVSAVLLAREQWMKVDGAPSTQTFSMHSPFAKHKMALGINLINDAIGPTKNTGAFLSYAYHLKVSSGKLSLGLRGGIFNSMMDWRKLNYQDQSDRFIGSQNLNAIIPSFDFGAYYYTRKFYAGISSTHLNETKYKYNNYPNDANLYLRRHYMITLGAAFEINKNLVLKPSTLIKYVENVPVNVDLNFSTLYKKIWWIGASYRSSGSIVGLTEFNLAETWRIGYACDVAINRMKRYSGLSHELMLGVDFNFKKTKSVSPRYL